MLRVIPDGAPKTMDDVPQRADVFSRTYGGQTIPAVFTPQTRIVIPPGGAIRPHPNAPGNGLTLRRTDVERYRVT